MVGLNCAHASFCQVNVLNECDDDVDDDDGEAEASAPEPPCHQHSYPPKIREYGYKFLELSD